MARLRASSFGFSLRLSVHRVLSLRFRDEAETPAIPEYATGCADGECAGIPERAEAAGRGTEFGQALLAPCEVVEFLVRGPLHLMLD